MLGYFHTYHYAHKPQTCKLILLPLEPFTSQTLLTILPAPYIEAEFQC